MHTHSYMRLAAMAALSFAAMYILMYAMADRLANVYPNLNQAYMAGLMTAPMVLIELLLMSAMYENKIANMAILAVSATSLLLFFVLIRTQTAITNSEFLRSMIPHHAGAILMCNEAPIDDAKIKELCKTIISSQQAEIVQMKAMLSASVD